MAGRHISMSDLDILFREKFDVPDEVEDTEKWADENGMDYIPEIRKIWLEEQ